MKYFTADLLERFGSPEPAVYQPAQAEWELRCENYNVFLESIKRELPPGLLLVEENYLLHDAVIRGMGRHDHAFVIILQLDAPPNPLVTLTYDLVAEPVVEQGVLPPEQCTPETHVEWQYDEIERSGEAWAQSILLSNGWEVRLFFRDVKVEEAQALIPPPRHGMQSEFGTANLASPVP